MKEKIVTVDELWVEFEKVIKFGDYKKFKTKRGMMRHVKRMANKYRYPGSELVFNFKTGRGYNFLRCRLKIKKEWIK